MATLTRVCKSSRRVAYIDAFPAGSDYSYHVNIFDHRFIDDGLDVYICPRKCADIYLNNMYRLDALLKYFGLNWVSVRDSNAALVMLQDDYDERMRLMEEELRRVCGED